MPFWIEGWIEVARLPETADEHAWSGVVNLGAIVDVADEDTEQIFGMSKGCVSGEKSVAAIAAARGVPANPSVQVRRALDEIEAHEAKFGTGEMGGYTWALWDEIRGYALKEPPEDSQWTLSFAFARTLEERFGADRVRFVVWFNW
ncbi:hypothetical protein Psta_0436 [Pirellula staleyi DSM 6068]|uniref:Uncharacterized protein n=1 Tax=Pirellula staleyi (strain ATCC 27377 / DSM 6068 / ICPB 4128) TaxID=530564 RepID=D2R395_PIRSD|nr:hypothetical protein [Pirellula staleyi]ADB15126.1 hypothetical protein Psta_0436 [Pirellula staleyi DSM 6068]